MEWFLVQVNGMVIDVNRRNVDVIEVNGMVFNQQFHNRYRIQGSFLNNTWPFDRWLNFVI